VSEVCREVLCERGELDTPPANRAIATVAGAQHGVIARTQIRAVGLSDAAIDRRVASGALHRVHRGVYAVGHPVLGPHGYWMAAVLACGNGAVLSHAAAAALWGMRHSAAERTDVTVPGTSGRGTRARLRIHRTRTLPRTEVTTRHSIPVTTAGRTILDMAAILQRARLERLLDQAEIRELTDYPALAALARAHPGHRGAARLLSTLETHLAGEQPTRSDVEAQFRQLCCDHGLPRPRVNQRVAGKEVDFLFADQRLVVETDSWRYHKTRRAFEDDRARDAITARAGYRTLRITDRQLTRDAAAIAATVHRLLTQG
jgi:very-short-patch-repair endonuclease